MTCAPQLIAVVSGLSDPETLVFGYKTGGVVTAFDFSTATNVVGELYQSGESSGQFDNDDTPGIFDWSGAEGELVVDFGLTNLPAGVYQVRIVVISPGFPVGRVLNRGDGYTMDIRVVA